jgi:hypothetical protein
MKPTHSTPPFEALPDVAFDNIPPSGWAIFPAGQDAAIAVMLGPHAEANAQLFAEAPHYLATLRALAQTPLQGQQSAAKCQKRLQDLANTARRAIQPLDYCGLDCPECGGTDTLGAVGSRPLKTGETASVRCKRCGFTHAHLRREADGSLVLQPGPTP